MNKNNVTGQAIEQNIKYLDFAINVSYFVLGFVIAIIIFILVGK